MGQNDVLRPPDAAAARDRRRLADRADRSPYRPDRTRSRRDLPLPNRCRQRLRHLAGGDATFSTYQPPSILGFSSSESPRPRPTSAPNQPQRLRNGIRSPVRTDGGLREERADTRRRPPGRNTTETVAVHLNDLEGIVYHFRVVAHNTWGTTASADRTFTFFPPSCPNGVLRQKTGSSYLPDCRAYELVCPRLPGTSSCSPFPLPAPYAQNPSRFLYLGLDGVCRGTGGTNAFSADTYVTTRTTSGWVTKYTGIPLRRNLIQLVRGRQQGSRQIHELQKRLLRRPGALRLRRQRRLPRAMAGGLDRLPRSDRTQRRAWVLPTLARLQPHGLLVAEQLRFRGTRPDERSRIRLRLRRRKRNDGTHLEDANGGDIAQDPSSTDPKEVINFPGPEPLGRGCQRKCSPASRSTGPTS